MYLTIGVPPAMPSISKISVTSTTASISWDLSYVTSYNEYYYIEYKGLLYDISAQTSQTINALLNIQSYNITLTGLEEANSYQFSIIATNYVGNSSSSLMNFTTLEDGKLKNCDNMLYIVIYLSSQDIFHCGITFYYKYRQSR